MDVTPRSRGRAQAQRLWARGTPGLQGDNKIVLDRWKYLLDSVLSTYPDPGAGVLL